jgi:hypothetical protein
MRSGTWTIRSAAVPAVVTSALALALDPAPSR